MECFFCLVIVPTSLSLMARFLYIVLCNQIVQILSLSHLIRTIRGAYCHDHCVPLHGIYTPGLEGTGIRIRATLAVQSNFARVRY
jgi:hypothetical protein